MLQALVNRQGGVFWSKIQRSGLEKSRLQPFFRLIKSIEANPRCSFVTSSSRMLAKKARPSSKSPKPSPQPSKIVFPAAPQHNPSYGTFADLLATRKSPTLLFEASSRLWYTISCYTLGGFCLSYAGINFYWQYLYPPEGIWKPTPILMGVICGFMLLSGVLFISKVSWH